MVCHHCYAGEVVSLCGLTFRESGLELVKRALVVAIRVQSSHQLLKVEKNKQNERSSGNFKGYGLFEYLSEK